ncbi:MAG: hypothetical protein AAFN79_15835 [Pseudomonadota bacterium]
MSEEKAQTDFRLYQLYAATTQAVSEQRAGTNKWMLTVNSAITSLYGFLAYGKSSAPDDQHVIWLIAIPCAGAIVCFAWAAMLASYRKLNAAKFAVIHEMEAALPSAPFLREREIYRSMGRRPLSQVEKLVPFAFVALYAALAAGPVAGVIGN